MNRYDQAFKEEAVRLSECDWTKESCRAIGRTLQGWRKQRTLHGDGAHIGSGRAYASVGKTAREIELEREIGELRRANEILKDALGFFAKDRKR